MLLFDVNIYVYAHRVDTPHHETIKKFVDRALSGDAPVGYSPLALSGFLRVVTHPKVMNPPTDFDLALEFCDCITNASSSFPTVPGDAHWSIFTHILRASGAKGNFIPDAWFAALAVERGCTWVTTDGDYHRFPGLKILNPLLTER